MKKRYEELETDDGTTVRYRRHDNGGGLVAMAATVDPTTYVAETAWVDPGARIGGGVHIGAHVWVEPDAVVGPYSQLGTHVHVGRAHEATWLAQRSLVKLPDVFALPSVDVPVLGGVLLAVGAWSIATGSRDLDAAVELVALGRRFGYPRYIHTLAWSHVRAVVDPVAPGRLDGHADQWVGTPVEELRERARVLVARLAATSPGGTT